MKTYYVHTFAEDDLQFTTLQAIPNDDNSKWLKICLLRFCQSWMKFSVQYMKIRTQKLEVSIAKNQLRKHYLGIKERTHSELFLNQPSL